MGGGSINGGSPNGWFISWTIPIQKMDDLGYWRATVIKFSWKFDWFKRSTAVGCWIKQIVYRYYSYGHLPVITGYKWDYPFYKWGYKYL